MTTELGTFILPVLATDPSSPTSGQLWVKSNTLKFGSSTNTVLSMMQGGNNLSELGSLSTARTNLGLGTLAVQNAAAVALSGGAIDGIPIGNTTRSTAKFTTGDFNDTTAATSATTGALTVAGGMSAQGAIYAGANVFANGQQLATAISLPNKNFLLNGDFFFNNDIKNGTAFTTTGYFNDAWGVIPGSANCTPTIIAFGTALGTPALVNLPSYYLRYVQNSNASTSPGIYQRIENVRTLAGQTVTLSFYASSGANLTTRNIILNQNFGTGGSPSSTVQTVISTGQAITTTWTKYSFTFTIPSITGMTEGSNLDSFLEFILYLPISSTYTFNITNVKLEVGSFATPFDTSLQNRANDILAINRFYQLLNASVQGYSTLAAGTFGTSLPIRTPMRTSPTATVRSTGTSANLASGSPSVAVYSAYGAMIAITAAAAGATAALNVVIALDARY